MPAVTGRQSGTKWPTRRIGPVPRLAAAEAPRPRPQCWHPRRRSLRSPPHRPSAPEPPQRPSAPQTRRAAGLVGPPRTTLEVVRSPAISTDPQHAVSAGGRCAVAQPREPEGFDAEGFGLRSPSRQAEPGSAAAWLGARIYSEGSPGLEKARPRPPAAGHVNAGSDAAGGGGGGKDGVAPEKSDAEHGSDGTLAAVAAG